MLKLGKSNNTLHVNVSNNTAKMTLMKSECLEPIWSVDLMFEGAFCPKYGESEEHSHWQDYCHRG